MNFDKQFIIVLAIVCLSVLLVPWLMKFLIIVAWFIYILVRRDLARHELDSSKPTRTVKSQLSSFLPSKTPTP